MEVIFFCCLMHHIQPFVISPLRELMTPSNIHQLIEELLNKEHLRLGLHAAEYSEYFEYLNADVALELQLKQIRTCLSLNIVCIIYVQLWHQSAIFLFIIETNLHIVCINY